MGVFRLKIILNNYRSIFYDNKMYVRLKGGSEVYSYVLINIFLSFQKKKKKKKKFFKKKKILIKKYIYY